MAQKSGSEAGPMKDSIKVSRAQGAAFRQLDGKAFIVGARSNKLVMLNDTGSAVWSYLEAPATVSELALKLEREFEVDQATARADCEGFLSKLVSRDLVELDESASKSVGD
jgi:hypothetical protein